MLFRSTISGSCHCGAVSFIISENPGALVDCNCSICRRIGALWGHVPIAAVTITAPEHATIAYIQGDRKLAVHSCRVCGCTTHWENLCPEEYQHMAVNFRMCEPATIARFTIRPFHGAETWTFLD